MEIIQKYYKGTFIGLFKKIGKDNKDKIVFSKIHWSYLRIENVVEQFNYDIEGNKTGDFWFAEKVVNKNGFHPFKKETEVFIPRGENLAYSGDIFNVLLKNLKFNFNNGAHGPHFECTGDIYFQIAVKNEIEIQEVKEKKENNVAVTILGNEERRAGDDATNKVSTSGTDAQLPGIEIRDPLKPKSSGCGNSIGTIFWLAILAYAFFNSMPLFWGLLVIAILWGITRFFFKNILGRIFTFILIVVLAFYAMSYVFKKGKEILPDQTKKGSIKVAPPREGDKKPGSNEKDLISDKSINWFDFKNSVYQADYSTSSLSFLATQNKHQALVSSINANSSVDYFNQVYQGLNNYDSKKVDMLVDVFKDSARRMNLNSLQLAEMVTTFIQEIPYVLVHDGSCAEAASSGGFVKEWHQDSKPCLAKIPAGVQSPYEFIHNLKGDCDTRTLLAFTILKKLKIPASIWVSEAYGHSILGIGLPFASGFHKEVSGVNHYSAELTSKCRIGFVSPDQNEESNWDIALYYQP